MEARNLTKAFVTRANFLGVPKEYFLALNDVSLQIEAGETLGLVGESGSGKSTLGRLFLHLLKPDLGTVVFQGESGQKGSSLRSLRKSCQIVFQDPDSAFDPRWTIGRSATEGLSGVSKYESNKRLQAVLALVGLPSNFVHKHPHQLSGGQKQRAAIARALIMEPQFLVLDEVVSALDVSTQAQIIALLKQIQRELGLTMLFISHDLAVVAALAQKIAVMWQGKIVELGSSREVVASPQHPYTRKLFSAVPTLQKERRRFTVDPAELETLSLQQRVSKLQVTSYQAEKVGEEHWVFVP